MADPHSLTDDCTEDEDIFPSLIEDSSCKKFTIDGGEEEEERKGEEYSSSDDGYDKGLPGTTPPSGGRYHKMTRRGHKHKTNKKSLGQVTVRHSLSNKGMRAKSAEWSSTYEHESLSPRRHTLPDVSWPPVVEESSATTPPITGGVDERDKKRRQDRQKERNVKSAAMTDPLLNESPPSSHSLMHTFSPPPLSSYSSPPSMSSFSNITYHSPSPYPPPFPPLLSSAPPHPLSSSSHLSPSHLSPSHIPPSHIPPSHIPPSHVPPSHIPLSHVPPSPLSSNPLPIKHILPHLRPLKGSHSELNFDVSMSLSAVNRSDTGLPRIERSNSDAQLSLTISSSQSMHCPPDRKQFYRNFAKSLKLIAKRQQQSMPLHIPRQHSEDLRAKNPYAQEMDALWLELRAALAGRTADEQETFDHHSHCEVRKTLERVIHYCFNSPSIDKCFHGINEYQSLPVHLNKLAKEEEEDEKTPLNSITTNTYTGPTATTCIRWKDQLEKEEEEEEEDEEQGPRTLTQQESSDSDNSSVIHTDFTPHQFLNSDQKEALDEVNDLLHDLERVELLYPSTSKIDSTSYRNITFRRRHEGLILWAKVTEGLANHLSRLSKWFGVTVNPVTRSQLSISSSTEPSRYSSNGAVTTNDQPLYTPHYHSQPSMPDDINPEASLSLSALSLASSFFQTQSSVVSSSSSSRATLQRLFSSRNILSIDEERVSSKGYRKFVDQVLKKKKLEWLIDTLLAFVEPILNCGVEALKQHTLTDDEVNSSSEEDTSHSPIIRHFLPPPPMEVPRVNSVAPKCWMDEFTDMNLPSFAEQYLQLTRVPLDMMQECMRLRTELNKAINPTPYSVGKLVQEFHVTLKKAVDVRKFYRDRVQPLIANNPSGIDLVDADMTCYEKHLHDVLKMYFKYIEDLVQVSSTDRNLLETQWENAKDICTAISTGEVEAGLQFCHMALQLIERLEENLKTQIDTCCDRLHEYSDTLEDADEQKQAFTESCREFKSIILEAREASMKGLGFSKTLMTDLEIAAEFHISCSRDVLFKSLASSDHYQVIIPQYQACILFIPHAISDNDKEIQQLLGVSFGRPVNEDDDISHASRHRRSIIHLDSYLLIVKFDPGDSLPVWTGKCVHLTLSAETIVSISEMQVEGIKLIVRDSSVLEKNQMSFLGCMGTNVEISNKRTSSHHSVAERIDDLKHALCRFGHIIMEVVHRINEHLTIEEISEHLLQQFQLTMHSCYNLGFEYLQDLSRLFGDEFVHQKLGVEMLHFCQQWMIFVTTKCTRGHGKRPRWAILGLEFILLACSPRMLSTISHTRYENIKKQMERCLDHVIGEVPPSKKNISPPGWQKSKGYKRYPLHSSTSLINTPIEERQEDIIDGLSADSSGIDSPVLSGDLSAAIYSSVTPRTPPNSMMIPKMETIESVATYSSPSLMHTPSQESLRIDEGRITRTKRIQSLCEQLDRKRDSELRSQKVIGQVTHRAGASVIELGKLTDIKQSHFTWRRGRKLGEGQFGVVYECINLDQGEVQAVKTISLKEKSHNTVRDILSEIRVFLTIRHENIVHLHGVEIHDTDLYLFMEYCNQGTLWAAAKQGLTERLIRLYTRDLLRAVDALHEKGIVHRDIKGANIFLSDDSVKLGDFGLSVQLRNVNKTAPQEIKHQRGTIPYMSPEVVLKQDMGRPMDIWAIGCVVVEMYTSKHPWTEYGDNAFAIMYQLGLGKSPKYPAERMNDEMIGFLDLCFETDPKQRGDVGILLKHPFVEILDFEEDNN